MSLLRKWGGRQRRHHFVLLLGRMDLRPAEARVLEKPMALTQGSVAREDFIELIVGREGQSLDCVKVDTLCPTAALHAGHSSCSCEASSLGRSRSCAILYYY